MNTTQTPTTESIKYYICRTVDTMAETYQSGPEYSTKKELLDSRHPGDHKALRNGTLMIVKETIKMEVVN